MAKSIIRRLLKRGLRAGLRAGRRAELQAARAELEAARLELQLQQAETRRVRAEAAAELLRVRRAAAQERRERTEAEEAAREAREGPQRRSQAVSSSWLRHIHLIDLGTGQGPQLGVTFKSGVTVVYDSTGKADYESLAAAGSKGKWIHANMMDPRRDYDILQVPAG